MTTIAIYGANGYAGDAIRAEALRRGHDVLALSRSASAREGSTNGDLAVGDLYDPASVKSTVEKADVVVVAVPAHSADGKSLVDAAAEILKLAAEGGARVGFVGGAGSLQTEEGGPRLLDTEGFPAVAIPEATSHGELLDALRQSSVGSWFYLSPAALFGAHAPQEPVGSYIVGGDVLQKDSRGQSAISAEDYAVAFLDEIETPQHKNTRFSVIGAY
jgi:putative NADH-flavin reductase